MTGSTKTRVDSADSREEKERSRELTREFERVTIEFGFVNGGPRNLTYDIFTGVYGHPEETDSHIPDIRDGISETERGGVVVEKLCTVEGASPLHVEDTQNNLTFYGTESTEVTPSNVTFRNEVERVPMRITVPVEETVVVDADDEVVYLHPPEKTGETRIEEQQ